MVTSCEVIVRVRTLGAEKPEDIHVEADEF